MDLLLDPAEPATSPPCSPQGRTSPPNFSTPKPAPAANHLPPSAGDTTQTTTATTLASALQESSASSPKAATLNYQDLTLDSEPHERVRAEVVHLGTFMYCVCVCVWCVCARARVCVCVCVWCACVRVNSRRHRGRGGQLPMYVTIQCWHRTVLMAASGYSPCRAPFVSTDFHMHCFNMLCGRY